MTTLELAQELLDDIKVNGVRDVSIDYGIEHEDNMTLDDVVHAQEGFYLRIN